MFDPAVTQYTATTSNATNTVSVSADPYASITMMLNGTSMTGNTATWEDGENILSVKVMSQTSETTYTVTVTKI